MTSGIGLPYINIAVAESAVRLARSFDVTFCNIAFASKGLRNRGRTEPRWDQTRSV